MQLHVTEGGVWCAVSATGIIEPNLLFGYNKISETQCKNCSAVALNSSAEENKHVFFQQDDSIALHNLEGGMKNYSSPVTSGLLSNPMRCHVTFTCGNMSG